MKPGDRVWVWDHTKQKMSKAFLSARGFNYAYVDFNTRRRHMPVFWGYVASTKQALIRKMIKQHRNEIRGHKDKIEDSQREICLCEEGIANLKRMKP